MKAQRVIVVGAGPSGSSAALELRRRGIECTILERKPLPRTKACGSGLSPWTLSLMDEMGVGRAVRALTYRINGAILSGSNGEGLELRGDHETAILRRSELDYVLVQEAVSRGAQLMDGVTVKGLSCTGRGNKQIMGVTTSEGVLEADLVLDCSGATGRLERYSPTPAPTIVESFAKKVPLIAKSLNGERQTLHTIMGWYEGVSQCKDVVELFFDQELRPHYAWIFPETTTRVNIGLCFLPRPGGLNARQHFEAFLERRLKSRLAGATLLGKWIGHPVQVSTAPQSLVSSGVLRAGEAGFLADCATAEGIYHGLVSGRVAGRFSADHLERGLPRETFALKNYEGEIRRALLPRLLLGRALMGGLSVPALDWALRLGHFPATKSALTRAFTGLYHG